MEEEATQIRPCDADTIITGTYKLSALPLLITEGQFKGQLRSVAFRATSSAETMQWFAINCGQFEEFFSQLVSHRFATRTVDTLTRGQGVEFPGLYQKKQFDSGFHNRWSPIFADLFCPLPNGSDRSGGRT